MSDSAIRRERQQASTFARTIGASASNYQLVIILIGLVATSLAMFAITFDSHHLGLDDAYITYQYAQNLANGLGVVFNPGGPAVLGTSTPLYMGILAAGAWLGGDIPTLSIVIGGLATSATAVLLVLLAREEGLLPAGIASALTWILSPLSWRYLQGMETPVYIALILGTIWSARRGRPAVALFLAALTVLTRIDGIAVLAVVVVFLVIDHKWSWRALAPAGVLLAIWLGLATYWFGSPIPASGMAKMVHQSNISGQFSLLSRQFAYLTIPIAGVLQIPKGPMNWPLLGTLAVCATALIWRSQLFRMLAFWAVLYATGYLYLGLPNFSWYYGPLALVCSFILWSGLQRGIGVIAGAIPHRSARISGILVVLAAASLAGAVLFNTPSYLAPKGAN